MMICQYTTAALASENKSLCYPASADSIPTSLGQEDHVSMGSISGRKFNTILSNVEKILALELMLGAQAMDLRRPNRYSDKLESAHRIIRSRVDKLECDRLLSKDIESMIDLVASRLIAVDID
jgi:Histidine ammonia-lyase